VVSVGAVAGSVVGPGVDIAAIEVVGQNRDVVACMMVA
jgi:hypothetical protein